MKRFINLLHISKRWYGQQNGMNVGILGVPFNKGSFKHGVEVSPQYLRDAGIIQQIQNIDEKIDIKDYGDVSFESKNNLIQIDNMKNYGDVVSCTQEVSKNVNQIISDGRVCLTLGGDHSIAVGTVDGHMQASSKNVALLWIDAHGDINTNKTSVTANIQGMPIALLVKELSDYWPHLPGMDWLKPNLSVRNVAYIGLRDVDPYERYIFNKLGMAAFSMRDILIYGVDKIVDMALESIDPHQNKSIHVSFDIDSLDPNEAPSTVIPVGGGLSLREGIHIMEKVFSTGRLNAIDMVEIYPTIGSSADVIKTVKAAIQIIRAGLGFVRGGMLDTSIKQLPLQTFPPTHDLI